MNLNAQHIDTGISKRLFWRNQCEPRENCKDFVEKYGCFSSDANLRRITSKRGVAFWNVVTKHTLCFYQRESISNSWILIRRKSSRNINPVGFPFAGSIMWPVCGYLIPARVLTVAISDIKVFTMMASVRSSSKRESRWREWNEPARWRRQGTQESQGKTFSR